MLDGASMSVGTYLINSTKKEYIYLSVLTTENTGKYLSILEKICSWDLRNDDVYIHRFIFTLNYTNVIDKITTTSETGGEIIHEYFNI